MNDGHPRRLSELLKSPTFVERLDDVIPGLVYVIDVAAQQSVYANRAMAEFLGHSWQEVLALGPSLLATVVHPEDVPNAAAHHGRMARLVDGQVGEVEYRVRAAGGAWRWLHSWETVLDRAESGAPRRILGIAQDVTERVTMEEELRQSRQHLAESEQRWRSIAENPFDFVVVLDQDFKFVFVNFMAPGMREEDIIGKKSPLDFATGVDREIMRTAFEQVMRDGRATSYEVYTEPLGKWYHSLVGPIKTGERVTQLSVLTRDITKEKVAQAQARKVEQQLQQMELKLAQTAKLEAVGQLAGGIAHDFNNLLTGIAGVTELLALRLPESDPSHADVVDLRHAVERGAGLTRQLLAFSRQQPIAPTVVELNALIQDTSRMLRRLLGESVELVVVSAPVTLHVRADRTQLEQVLLNLAVNARDAISGSGRITLELAAMHVDARDRLQHPEARPGKFVRLRVTDTGAGMDPATQARIFEPFFTTKPIGSGTGLGLAMVHGIVTKAGGFVQVASQLGAGSAFDVWLPLVQETRTSEPAELTSRCGGSEIVLLVEDEELVLRLTTALLKQLGYTVLPSPRAEHALGRIAANERFDLLLTDVLLPGIDGPELYRRAARERGAFPVVFMSGYTADVLAEKGLAETGAAFLQKPFSHDELAAKVRAALDAHAALGLRSG